MMASELMKLARKNAERINVLNRFMASTSFPTFTQEDKDLFYEETRALSTLLQIEGKQLKVLENTQFSHGEKGIYPATIFRSRYGGAYAGGEWIALNLDIDDEFNEDMVGSDVPCANFWAQCKDVYGIGNSPDEALEDLKMKLRADKS